LRLIELNLITYTDLLSLLPDITIQTHSSEGEKLSFVKNAAVRGPKASKLVETLGMVKVYAANLHDEIAETRNTAHGPDTISSFRRDLGILVVLSVEIDSLILKHRPEIAKRHSAVVSDL
jgi:hypothetical protein